MFSIQDCLTANRVKNNESHRGSLPASLMRFISNHWRVRTHARRWFIQ